MRISDVRVRLLSAPYEEGYGWRTGYGVGYKRDLVLVFVDTDEGVTGIGESYHAFNGARTIESAILHSLRPLVIGMDPRDIESVWQTMFSGTLQLGSTAVAAMSGIDTALWDILGKVAGLPVYRLLGGDASELPAYVGCHTLGIQSRESLVDEAQGYKAAGYKAMKLRGGAGIGADIAAVSAVREALGDDIDIMMDANSAYSWPEAVRLVRSLEDFDVFWLEDPFDYSVLYHHGEMGDLRRLSSTPVASGANVYSRFDYRALIQRGGVDYITPDVVKGGGISECVKIAHMASAFGQLVGLHTVVGLGQFANAHLAAAIPKHVLSYVEWDPSPNNPLRDDIYTNPLEVRDGKIVLPASPGIGTDLRLDKLDEYPFIEGPEIEQAPRLRRWLS